MAPESNGPLHGLRVVDLSEFVAAPVAAKILADWGADVIKVERFAGDVWRWYGPNYHVPCEDDENPLFDMEHLNKKFLAIDLKTDMGRDIMARLLSKADIFITNYRVEALKRLDLTYEKLADIYPKLIYAHLSGFGEKGPEANRPGFDVVCYWARSGAMLDLVPAEKNAPITGPYGFGDHITGSTLVGGILASLYRREKSGLGDKVSISLYGAAIFGAGSMIMSSQEKYGDSFPRHMKRPANPVGHAYRCKDGEWILLSILAYERYWPIFCNQVLRKPEMVGDDRFKTKKDAAKNSAVLYEILCEEFIHKTSGEWSGLLSDADIAFEKLAHFKDVTKDEQAWANEYVFEHTFGGGNKAILPRTPIQFGGYHVPNPPSRAGTRIGEHTKEILHELGYTRSEIETMQAKKIVKSAT